MKDIWYGDNRDIVKWGGIVHLCSKTGIKFVLQIAYYRSQQWLEMSFDNDHVNIPREVFRHFRSLEDIKRLGLDIGINIQVINKEFSHSRRESYHNEILNCLNNLKERKIVFLDPDTGLAPNKAGTEHVKPNEVLLIWESLKEGDFLVLYQHSFRSKNWVNIRKKQLAEACHVEENKVGEWSSDLAKDVIIFFVTR